MNDSDALLIEIRADQKQLISDLNKANKSLDKFAADAEQGTKKAANGFESVAAVVKRLAGPAALLLLTKQMYDLTVGAMAFADHISDTSKQLGISTDAYQELAFAMNQSGIETSEFEMSMRRLQDMLGEATAGNEAAQNAFTDLGISIEQLKGLNAEQAFNLVANALGNVADASQRASAAKDIFGKAGANIAVVARDGAAAFDELRQKAQDLGIVMSESTVESAAELNDQFEAAKTLIGTEVKQAFLELAPVIVEVAQWIAKAAHALNDFLAGFKQAKNLSLGQTREELREINEELESLKNAANSEESLPSSERWGANIAYEAALQRKAELERHLRANRGGRGGTGETVASTTPAGKATFASKTADARKKAAAAERDKGLEEVVVTATKIYKSPLDEMWDDLDKKTRTSVENQIAELNEVESALNELLAAGKINQETYDARMGEALDKVLSPVEVTAHKIGEVNKSTTDRMLEDWANLAENMDHLFGDAIEGIAEGLSNMAMGGEMNVEDMAKSIIKNLIKIRLQAMLAGLFSGKSGLMGAIGGALGLPGRAGGGHMNQGDIYEINERSGRKRELFKAPSSGSMVPTGSQGSGSGGAVHVELINKGGDKKATAARPTQTGRDMIVQIVLEDLNKNGPISKNITNTFGTSRTAR